MIQKTITQKEFTELKFNNIKCHITTEIPWSYITGNSLEDQWNDFGNRTYPFTVIKSEGYGDLFKLSPDKSKIIIKEPCLFEFAGCVHFQNQEGTDKTPELGTRMYKNDKSEARCSQIYWSGSFKNGEENTIKYGGTDVSCKKNEYVSLRYYVTANSGISFISSSVFDNPVAATLYLKVIGLPRFTDKNEEINWTVID